MKKVLYKYILIGILSYSGFSYASIIDGLVAHYTFDGNAQDISGNNNHGIERNGIAYVDGINGQAVQFDGLNDYIQVNDSFAINSEMAISAWVNSNGIQPSQGASSIISKYNWFGDRSYNLYVNSNVYFSVREDTNVDGTVNPPDKVDSIFSNYSGISQPTGLIHDKDVDISINEFTHILINVDSSFVSMFINSELISSVPRTTTTIFDSSEPVYIGNAFNSGAGSNNHFWGEIDDLRIYDRALLETEIQDLANISSVPAPAAVWLVGSGLVGLFGMRKNFKIT